MLSSHPASTLCIEEVPFRFKTPPLFHYMRAVGQGGEGGNDSDTSDGDSVGQAENVAPRALVPPPRGPVSTFMTQ